MASARTWRIVIADSADADIDAIIDWTIATFGPRQAEAYHRRINEVFVSLAEDPLRGRSRDRQPDLGGDYRSLHLGRRARHLIVYRVESEHIFVLRVLHDSMDLTQHLPGD